MLFLSVFIFCMIVAIVLGVMAGLSDFRGMVIPNLYPVLIAGAFLMAFIAAYLSGNREIFHPFTSHLIAGGCVFAATIVLYALKIFGGGDAKLLSAYALWVGMPHLMPLLFFMAIFGGVLGIIALVIKRAKPFKNPKEGSWIAQLQGGKAVVPYGIPIVLGAIITFSDMSLFSMETIGLFVTGGAD